MQSAGAGVERSRGRPQVGTFQLNLYYATLLAAALSMVLFVAPAAQHRMLFGKQDEARLLGRFRLWAGSTGRPGFRPPPG